MSKSEAIIIGWINKGKPADCGETMKNQLMIRKLEELGIRCRQIDFKNWKRHPWVFFQLVWDIVVHRDNTLVLSTSASNIFNDRDIEEAELESELHTLGHWW